MKKLLVLQLLLLCSFNNSIASEKCPQANTPCAAALITIPMIASAGIGLAAWSLDNPVISTPCFIISGTLTTLWTCLLVKMAKDKCKKVKEMRSPQMTPRSITPAPSFSFLKRPPSALAVAAADQV